MTKKPSAVAGILDKQGGLRVVITQKWRMSHHVKKRERLFVLPDVKVQEPVPIEECGALVERVQQHVTRELVPTNDCGECRACCKEPITPPYPKADGSCQHCSLAVGCNIYWQRPKVCNDFTCEWLSSQSRNDRMGVELRPDRCGAIFLNDSTTDDPLVFEVHGEPNANGWIYINEMQRLGYKARQVVRYIP